MGNTLTYIFFTGYFEPFNLEDEAIEHEYIEMYESKNIYFYCKNFLLSNSKDNEINSI